MSFELFANLILGFAISNSIFWPFPDRLRHNVFLFDVVPGIFIR